MPKAQVVERLERYKTKSQDDLFKWIIKKIVNTGLSVEVLSKPMLTS